ncbi:MAG: hypothetical protein COA73_00640 [Candidatus Hydrogenedentota bacterium]|nr:MAG: hypothetical protein COA73_00640 [Candidatus Hydrogenedentota bacterium]
MYQLAYDSDLRQLRRDWESCVTALPAMLRMAESGILDKLNLKESTEKPDLMNQFTPLVLLYPQYQCEGFEEVSHELHTHANLAHLHFLVHTFIEDRLLDGQVDLARADMLLMKHMLIHGQALLDSLGRPDPWMTAKLNRLQENNIVSQISRYSRDPSRTPALRHSSIFRIASGRASFGILTTLALLHSQGVCRSKLRKVENAFNCLVTGLQWLDDLDDWEEDLANHDDNLLIFTLRTTGYDMDTSPLRNCRRIALGKAIKDKGVAKFAIKQAERYMKAASKKQRELGCIQLSKLIEIRISHLPLLQSNVLQGLE